MESGIIVVQHKVSCAFSPNEFWRSRIFGRNTSLMKHKPVCHKCFCNVLMALTRGPEPLHVHGFAPCAKCLFFTLPTGGAKNWNCSDVKLMDAETCETEELSIILTPAVTSGRERVAQQARLKVSNPGTPWAWTFQFWHPQPVFPLFPGWERVNSTVDSNPSSTERGIAFSGAKPLENLSQEPGEQWFQ